MEAAATIRPALSNLSLPVIDGQVPACLVHENSNPRHYRQLVCERLRAQLPVVLPDNSVDSSLEENLLRNMKALLQSRTERSGWPQWVPSDAHITLHLAAFSEPMSTESGQDLGNNLLMEVSANIICLGRELLALDAVSPGLGACVLKALDPLFTEAVTTELNIIRNMVEYNTEEVVPDLLDCTEEELQKLDDTAERGLESQGYEDENIPERLPSSLLRAAQLDVLHRPVDNLKHPRLVEHLQLAGVKNPARLAQILTKDLPCWNTVINGLFALVNCSDDDWECFTPYYLGDFVLLSARAEDVSSIDGPIGAHIDDDYDASMQDSDPNCVLAIDRVRKRFQTLDEVNTCGFLSATTQDNPMVNREQDSGDGLLLMAAMTAVFSAIDEAICLLQTIQHKETT